MADRRRGDGAPEPGSPEYQWLYGSDGTREPGPDATRQIRTQASQSAPGRPGERRRSQAPPPVQQQAAFPEHRDAPPGPPPGGVGTSVPPARGRRRGKGPWRVVKLVLLLWLVFMIATPLWAWSKVQRVEAITEHADSPASQSATTYLVVGSDSRGDLTKEQQKEFGTGGDDVGQRTDTIMLLHTGKGRNVLMSIPRDSRVEIPGRGVNKINAAFAWGGAPLLVQTIEKNTGIEIDHYVEIGFGGLVRMVDAVGGIEICPPKKMKDKQADLDIEAGCQQADGRTALGYARSRKTYTALGDVDRAKAQREVVSAIGAEAMSPMTFVNPVRYWRLAGATASSFTVSEGTSPFAFAQFGLAMTRVDGTSGLTCGVPLADLSVRWDAQRSREMFDHLIADDSDGIPAGLCTASGFPDK